VYKGTKKNESRTKRIHSFFLPSDSTFADSSAKVHKNIQITRMVWKLFPKWQRHIAVFESTDGRQIWETDRGKGEKNGHRCMFSRDSQNFSRDSHSKIPRFDGRIAGFFGNNRGEFRNGRHIFRYKRLQIRNLLLIFAA